MSIYTFKKSFNKIMKIAYFQGRQNIKHEKQER